MGGICFIISYFSIYICQDSIANYFDAVYEDERKLVYQIAEGDINLEEFPGASVEEDVNLRAITVYYTHDEKWDFFFRFPIIIQINEQGKEIPEYFINKETFIIDRTRRKRSELTALLTFVLIEVWILIRMVIRHYRAKYKKLS